MTITAISCAGDGTSRCANEKDPLGVLFAGTITIDPPTGEIAPGQEITLRGTYNPRSGSSGTMREADWDWRYTGPVVTITANGSSAVVRGVQDGTAEIVAANRLGAGAVDIGLAHITVKSPQPATATIDPGSVTLAPGEGRTFTCTVRTAAGAVFNNPKLKWSGGPSSVLSVDEFGKVTGVADGNGSVSCTVEGTTISATASISVRTPLGSISLSPSSVSILARATQQLTPTVRDVNGNIKPGAVVTWKSDNATIATVSNTGLVTGVTPGTTVVRASTAAGEAGSVNVQVLARGVTITLSGTNRIDEDATTTWTASVVDNVTLQAVTDATLTWTSGTPTIATVTATGSTSAQVHGLLPGTSQIKAEVGGIYSGSATRAVDVLTVPTGLRFTPATATVAVGSKVTLNVEVLDKRGQVVPGLFNIDYTSEQTQFATIGTTNNLTVEVNGVAPGTATIRAGFSAINLSSLTATAAVTVTAPASTCAGTTNFVYNVAVTNDPGGHAGVINMQPTKTIVITRTNGSVAVTSPSTPFIPVNGVVNPNTCALEATGTAAFLGFPAVKAEMTATYTASGKLVLTYRIGVNGELPGGQPITYTFTQQ